MILPHQAVNELRAVAPESQAVERERDPNFYLTAGLYLQAVRCRVPPFPNRLQAGPSPSHCCSHRWLCGQVCREQQWRGKGLTHYLPANSRNISTAPESKWKEGPRGRKCCNGCWWQVTTVRDTEVPFISFQKGRTKEISKLMIDDDSRKFLLLTPSLEAYAEGLETWILMELPQALRALIIHGLWQFTYNPRSVVPTPSFKAYGRPSLAKYNFSINWWSSFLKL